MGWGEINVILKSNGKNIPIEVKEKAHARDIEKLRRNMKYINAGRGIIITLNQEMDYGDVEVYSAYELEDMNLKWLLT